MIAIGRPKQCPECAYDLTGLSPNGKCPECGLGFDEGSLYWYPETPRVEYFSLLIMAFGGIPTGARAYHNLRSGGPWETEELLFVLFAIVIVVLLLWEAWRLYQSNKRGRYAAIIPDGVRARSIKDTRAISWEQMEHIRVSAFDVTVVDRSGRSVCIPAIRGSEKEAIVGHLNDRLRLRVGSSLRAVRTPTPGRSWIYSGVSYKVVRTGVGETPDNR